MNKYYIKNIEIEIPYSKLDSYFEFINNNYSVDRYIVLMYLVSKSFSNS